MNSRGSAWTDMIKPQGERASQNTIGVKEVGTESPMEKHMETKAVVETVRRVGTIIGIDK